MEVRTTRSRGPPGSGLGGGGYGSPFVPPDVEKKRWALKCLDEDALMAASLAVAWPDTPAGSVVDVEEEAAWFRRAMWSICDCSMPRSRALARRATYWWSPEIAQMRYVCARARRLLQRARRRRRRDPAREQELYEGYRELVVALQLAIKKAKARAWSELLEVIDREPWGRPYRMVMGKLRPWAPPVTETLDPEFLGRVVDTLFPSNEEGPFPELGEADPDIWSADMGVTVEELARAVMKMKARNTAPGPDGIPGRAMALALRVLGPRLRRLFDGCLRAGRVPSQWKRGRMVLIKKIGKPADSPSAYRPICLLDEVGKLFERVLASRLSGHLSRVGPDLAESQFGFRGGRSTVDAISRVRSLSDSATSQGGVGLAVSLDITNAFNSLPWGRIRGALTEHGVPLYVRRVLGDYLRDRWIDYPGRNGRMCSREVDRGVPQGSVLGPILWDIGYDAVLRAPLPAGVSVTCYADDTLLLATGRDWRRTIRLAETGLASVVNGIRGLGLKISPQKTEAMWFHDRPRGGGPPRSWITVGGSYVQVGDRMNYLGLLLDSRWRFEVHFDRLVPRLERTAAALGRLLPNIGGPEERVRRLYTGVVRSMALYGAPVWASALMVRRRSRQMLRRVQRRMAIRVARGYRTISHEAALTLAGTVPFDFLAEGDASIYERLHDLRQGGAVVSLAEEVEVRRQARLAARAKWKAELLDRGAAQRAVGAVLPSLDEWLDRGRGRLTYRVTQVLTGHGCFGEFLCRIRAEATAECRECGAAQDTAQHTLAECPAWAGERRDLTAAVGADLSLSSIVRKMLGSERAWNAMASFCEGVLRQKEASERDRELSDPARRERRRGRARRPRPLARSPPPAV